MQIKVGDRFKTNKGGDVVVVEYVDTRQMTVEFDDPHKHRVETTKTVLLKGDIKNPFAPLLFGVGYMGVGAHKTKEGASRLGFGRAPAYSAWANMLSRCYNPGYAQSEGYSHVVVDEHWHNYQVFAEWYLDQIKTNSFDGALCLDKDILTDEYTYSESNCCVIPYIINLEVKKARCGKYMTGVVPSKGGFKSRIQQSDVDKIYTTEVEAHLDYVKAKSNKIREVAVAHKEYLPSKVFEALMTRDFRYKFSPMFKPGSKSIVH